MSFTHGKTVWPLYSSESFEGKIQVAFIVFYEDKFLRTTILEKEKCVCV